MACYDGAALQVASWTDSGVASPPQNAFKSYVRMRDYCATSKQIVAMCLAVIKTGFELGNYVHVQNYIQKAEQTPNIEVVVLILVYRHVNVAVTCCSASCSRLRQNMQTLTGSTGGVCRAGACTALCTSSAPCLEELNHAAAGRQGVIGQAAGGIGAVLSAQQKVQARGHEVH